MSEGRAQNLYELCEQVCDAIAASPTNYYQGDWSCDAKSIYGEEACGTAFCRAGWMVALSEGKSSVVNITAKAYHMLQKAGIPGDSVGALFSGAAVLAKEGTPAYTEQGIAGMREFMARWEKELKGAPLPKEE